MRPPSLPELDGLTNVAADYTAKVMAHAIRAIDLQFGNGYAAAHPDLVGAFMQTSAIVVHSVSPDQAAMK